MVLGGTPSVKFINFAASRIVELSAWVYIFAVKDISLCPIRYCAVLMSITFFCRSVQYVCLRLYGKNHPPKGKAVSAGFYIPCSP